MSTRRWWEPAYARTLNNGVRAARLGALVLLAACGGGGDGAPPPVATFTIGGTVAGLAGTGLVLRNAGEDLGIGTDGIFSFTTEQPAQADYKVTVNAQPTGPWQTCVVNRGAGTVASADVRDIEVNCSTNTYTVGGEVSGVDGGALVLRNNGQGDLSIIGSATQPFTFGTPVASGDRYAITIAGAPPAQVCTLNNAGGQIEDRNITSVTVSCSTISFTIGGTVSGLLPQDPASAGLVLNNNANERLAVHDTGSFTFSVPVALGSSYNVSVDFQPTSPAQTCFVTPATRHGDSVAADVTTVDVQCLAPARSGSLDPDFGSGGIVLVDFESLLGPDTEAAAVIQPSAAETKLLIAGTTGAAASLDFALVRLNADGTRDAGFNGGGNDGFVRTDISPAASNSIDHVQAIARQSDGKIVVAGYTGTIDFALARYTPEGQLDTSFGTNGITITSINLVDRAYAMAIDRLDRIVVVGQATGTGEDFAVVRYRADGTPDPDFNGGDAANTSGAVRTHFSSDDRAQAVAIQQADDKIVVAGYANGSSSDFAVARYHDDGRLDTTFGPAATGKVTTNLGSVDRATAMVIQPTGEIVLAGHTGAASATNFALVRYLGDGSLDPSFDGDGIVVTDIGGNDDRIHAMTLDTGGRIVVAGSSHNGINNDFALARYTASGTLDGNFGNGGIVTTPIGGGEDIAYSVVIQPDGKIVAVGQAENGTNGNNVNTDFAAIRVSP